MEVAERCRVGKSNFLFVLQIQIQTAADGTCVDTAAQWYASYAHTLYLYMLTMATVLTQELMSAAKRYGLLVDTTALCMVCRLC